MSKKPIIVFEGIEGSGKSYHLNYVSKYLKQRKGEMSKIISNNQKLKYLMET